MPTETPKVSLKDFTDFLGEGSVLGTLINEKELRENPNYAARRAGGALYSVAGGTALSALSDKLLGSKKDLTLVERAAPFAGAEAGRQLTRSLAPMLQKSKMSGTSKGLLSLLPVTAGTVGGYVARKKMRDSRKAKEKTGALIEVAITDALAANGLEKVALDDSEARAIAAAIQKQPSGLLPIGTGVGGFLLGAAGGDILGGLAGGLTGGVTNTILGDHTSRDAMLRLVAPAIAGRLLGGIGGGIYGGVKGYRYGKDINKARMTDTINKEIAKNKSEE